LKVEAFAQSFVSAHQVVVTHEPLFKAQLIGVHPAIPNGVDGSTLQSSLSRCVLSKEKTVAVASGLLHEEERESAVGE
jgi:hypothetical protein